MGLSTFLEKYETSSALAAMPNAPAARRAREFFQLSMPEKASDFSRDVERLILTYFLYHKRLSQYYSTAPF